MIIEVGESFKYNVYTIKNILGLSLFYNMSLIFGSYVLSRKKSPPNEAVGKLSTKEIAPK